MDDTGGFAAIETTVLADVLGRDQVMDTGLRPLWPAGRRVAGPAFTVVCAPGDNLMLHAAIYRAPPGSVLACEAGSTEYAVAGGNVCAVAQRRGIAALVVDGAVRDIAEVRAAGFPVWGRAVTPVAGRKAAIAPLGQPVRCGGVRVSAGDIIVADDDGVVVVPAEQREQVLAQASAKSRAEARQSLEEWQAEHHARIEALLAAAGHDVRTPALTGIGERSHLASPQVTLTTHIQDVVNEIWYHDLRDIVLLGFSYGGMVVTGAVPHIGDRVSHLVYLDAFLPGDGQSLTDLTGQPGGQGPAGPDQAPGPGQDWLVAAPPRDFDDPAEAAFARPRRTPHPAGCFTEPVAVPRPLEDYPFTRTYIKATAEAYPTAFWDAASWARSSPAWRYREVATNHMVASNRPEELARLLLELA